MWHTHVLHYSGGDLQSNSVSITYTYNQTLSLFTTIYGKVSIFFICSPQNVSCLLYSWGAYFNIHCKKVPPFKYMFICSCWFLLLNACICSCWFLTNFSCLASILSWCKECLNLPQVTTDLIQINNHWKCWFMKTLAQLNNFEEWNM